MTALPHVDTHRVTVEAPRAEVWEALERYVRGSLAKAAGSRFTRLLGTEPAAGFAVSDRAEEERLELSGRHRFSRYRLTFVLADAPDGERSELRALTHAVFPGPHGRVYRTLVIGTRLHVLATKRILRAIGASAEAQSARPAH